MKVLPVPTLTCPPPPSVSHRPPETESGGRVGSPHPSLFRPQPSQALYRHGHQPEYEHASCSCDRRDRPGPPPPGPPPPGPPPPGPKGPGCAAVVASNMQSAASSAARLPLRAIRSLPAACQAMVSACTDAIVNTACPRRLYHVFQMSVAQEAAAGACNLASSLSEGSSMLLHSVAFSSSCQVGQPTDILQYVLWPVRKIGAIRRSRLQDERVYSYESF